MQFTQASSSHRRTSSIRSRRPLLTAVFLCTAAPLAGASQVAARPGSLLIFPEFDNRPGQNTLLTVTNTHASPVLGNVQVEFVYVDEDTCQEFNRTETLTGRDTLTLLTAVHNFDDSRGYVYAFAKRNGQAISHNHLIGHSVALDSFTAFAYSLNPLTLRAIGPDGSPTDNGDGRRDMDGSEYEPVPDRIDIPRYFGQGFYAQVPPIQSDLILVSLAGGSAFTTSIYFQTFNDNEETFSTTHSFFCWERIPLQTIAPIFSGQFLRTFTNHDPSEVIGLPQIETGWLWIDGVTATSSADTILDPAFLAVLIERSGLQSASDLPFGFGGQNGEILSHSIFSDL